MNAPLPTTHEVTELLLAWSNGEKTALESLAPLVYNELHRLAHHYMSRERPDHTLQTSALVNEAYLRLVDQKRVQCQNRAHFFAISAQLMRQILINHAQSRRCLKRGRGARKVSLDRAIIVSEERSEDLLALDDALNELAKVDPRKSKVVELLNAPAGSRATVDFGGCCGATAVDSDLKPQTVNEATAGVEYEVIKDLTVGFRGVYRAQG